MHCAQKTLIPVHLQLKQQLCEQDLQTPFATQRTCATRLPRPKLRLKGGSVLETSEDGDDVEALPESSAETRDNAPIRSVRMQAQRRARHEPLRGPKSRTSRTAQTQSDEGEASEDLVEDDDEDSSTSAQPIRRRGRPPGKGKGAPKGRRRGRKRATNSEDEDDRVLLESDGELENEEEVEAALKSLAEDQAFIRQARDGDLSSPRAAKYTSKVPPPGTAAYAQYLNFTSELAYNATHFREVTDAGPNPYANWEDEHDEGDLPEHDGLQRYVGEDGRVYVADGSGLEHVDEDGFDEHGTWHPFKDMGDARYDELLERYLEEDRQWVEEMDRKEDEEVMQTGSLGRLIEKEWLDEDGYLRPECLEPNSTFLKANDLVRPGWVLPSRSKIRWRGPDIDADEIGGAVKEWDMACNWETVLLMNESTILRHTGVGCCIELFHRSDGWIAFRAGSGEQTYALQPNGLMAPTLYMIAEDLVEFMEDEVEDDFEFKMRATHWIAGRWRGMLCGPRVVVWNKEAPETEIHLTDDGFIFIGDSGRAIQVKANALHPDRVSMYFTNSIAAFEMIRNQYSEFRPCMWERVETEDLTGSSIWIKVMRHEQPPDPKLRWLTDEQWKTKKELVRKGKMALGYDRDQLVQDMWDDRARALQLRNQSTETFVPSTDHVKDLQPGFNELFNLSGTAGKGFYDENGAFQDDWAFTEIPRYRQKLAHTDNELEEKRHFERLAELKQLKHMYKAYKLASCPPNLWPWQYRHRFGQFDMQGLPTHHLDGTPLTPEEREVLETDFREHEDVHEEFKKKQAVHPDLLTRLSNQIDYLQTRVSFYDPYQMTTDAETADLAFMEPEAPPEEVHFSHLKDPDAEADSSSNDIQWTPRWDV